MLSVDRGFNTRTKCCEADPPGDLEQKNNGLVSEIPYGVFISLEQPGADILTEVGSLRV